MASPNTAKTVPAAAETQAAAPVVSSPKTFDPTKIKIVKQVSTNLLKLRAGSLVFVTILAAMAKAKPTRADAKATEAKKEPPTLLPVLNLETGEVQTIIAGTVLVDLLNDEYPGESYVKKSFRVEVKEKKDAQAGGGRSYNTYDVKEIAV